MATDPTIAILADAVADALRAATLSQDLTTSNCRRRWFPFWKSLEDIKALQVLVVPNVFAETEDDDDRGDGDETFTIFVGVQKKLTEAATDGNVENSEVDPLVYLCEEIRDLFFRKRLSNLGITPTVDAAILASPYTVSPEHMAESRTFTGIVTLTLHREG